MPMNIVDVDWEIARDARFQNIVQQGTALARPELGHSVHVEVAGLEPAREYWYRFRAGDEVSQIGRTRTAPPAGAPVDRLRFAVCGCQHYEDGYFTAFRRIAEEQFDFIFHTGDYIYEGRADGGQERSPLPPAQRRRDLHAERLPQPLRAVQERPRPDRGACLGAVGRHLGRSRSRQQLRRRHRREQHAAGDLRAAPRGRLSGVLRGDAAARERAAVRQPHAHLPAPAVRQPDRSQRPRHPAVAIRSAVRRRIAHQLRRAARADPDDDGGRAGEVAVRQPRDRQGAMDGDRPAGVLVRVRSRRRRIPTASSRWTSGTATWRRGSACTSGCSRPTRRIRSCCQETCISTTAPT